MINCQILSSTLGDMGLRTEARKQRTKLTTLRNHAIINSYARVKDSIIEKVSQYFPEEDKQKRDLVIEKCNLLAITSYDPNDDDDTDSDMEGVDVS